MSSSKITNRKYYTCNGRKYYRHESGLGSVMCWTDYDGSYRETLILDIAFAKGVQILNRGLLWGADITDVSAITNYSENVFDSDFDVCDDEWLNNNLPWYDEHTSKENTDAMMSDDFCNKKRYAAGYCRSIEFDGLKCDLPNMQTLIRIWCDRNLIHKLDKTDKTNCWRNWEFGDYFGSVWSSSQYNEYAAWFVGDNDKNRIHLHFSNIDSNRFGVVPVAQIV